MAKTANCAAGYTSRNGPTSSPCRAHTVWSSASWTRQRVEALLRELPAESWRRLSVGEGSKGPRVYVWACLRLHYESPAGWAQGILARRSLTDPTEIAYYRVFAPEGTPLEELARVAGTRWAIEEGFERAKGEVGPDRYEVRCHDAWYRHIMLCLLAHAYLEVTRWQATQREDAEKGARRAT